MTEQRRTDLKELQKLDMRIHEAQQRILDFDPLFEEVEEPALILEGDLKTTRSRLQEITLEERRLERSVEDKHTRQKRLNEKLGSVRNLREEAAVSAELEMVKRTLQNEEQEALSILDQVRKLEERTAELEAAFAEASELVEPKKNELLTQKADAEQELASLRTDRERSVDGMDTSELKVYHAIRSGGRSVAVAELTEDGACSHCFGVIPLQLQNEIRHGDRLIRCEGCGVILATPEPKPEGVEPEAEDAEPEPEEEAPESEEGESEAEESKEAEPEPEEEAPGEEEAEPEESKEAEPEPEEEEAGEEEAEPEAAVDRSGADESDVHEDQEER